MTPSTRPGRARSAIVVLASTCALAASVASGASAAAGVGDGLPRPGSSIDAVAAARAPKVPWGSRAARFVPGRVVVVWRRGVPVADRRALAARAGVVPAAGSQPSLGTDVVGVPKGLAGARVLRSLRRSPLVRFAEPDRIASVAGAPPPNDPLFSDQWALRNTGQLHPLTIYGADSPVTSRRGTPGSDVAAPEAWAAQRLHQPVVVAVIDTGVDFSNPDLVNRMWLDPNFPRGGWDFAGGDDDPSPRGRSELNSHGTHVAGIVAAETDNATGIAGVCPDCRIMALRIGSASSLSLGAELKAIRFAVAQGADIINLSFGSPAWSAAERSAITRAGRRGVLVVAAAGNASADNDVPLYLSSSIAAPIYPASYTLPTIVSVAASNDRDEYGYASQCKALKLPIYRCGFTSWGHDSVDLAAPGVDILSTVRIGRGSTRFGAERDYDVWDGTSMAAPIVSGVAGLVRAEHPDYSPVDVKNAVMNGVDHPRALVLYDALASFTGMPRRALSGHFTVTQGRVDALKGLSAPTADATPSSDGNIDGARRIDGRIVRGHVAWPADANDVYRRRLERGDGYRISLAGPSDADLDLWVWKPGTKEIAQFTAGCFVGSSCPALAGESGRLGSNEQVVFTAGKAGTYYVQVNGWYSGGRYRLRLERL